jgi:hypothetical protein
MLLCGLFALLHQPSTFHARSQRWLFTNIGTLHLQSACLSTCDLGDFLRHGGWGRFSIVLVTFVFTQLPHTSWRPVQMPNHRCEILCEPGETFLTISKNRTDEKRERREGRWAIITAGLKKQVELGQSSR